MRTSPESPRRIAVAVVVALALTAAAVPAVAALAAWAFPAPEHRYRGQIVCGEEGMPSRHCHLQDLPRGEFVDHYDARRTYRRCVTKPSGATYCNNMRTAPLADTPGADPLDIDQLGRWRVTWAVKGHRVAEWSFTVAW